MPAYSELYWYERDYSMMLGENSKFKVVLLNKNSPLSTFTGNRSIMRRLAMKLNIFSAYIGPKFNIWFFPSRQLHAKIACNLAARCIQIVSEWPKVACKLYSLGCQSQANSHRFYSSCMRLQPRWYNCKRLTVTQVQQPIGNNLNATGSQYSTKLPVFESTLPEQLFE